MSRKVKRLTSWHPDLTEGTFLFVDWRSAGSVPRALLSQPPTGAPRVVLHIVNRTVQFRFIAHTMVKGFILPEGLSRSAKNQVGSGPELIEMPSALAIQKEHRRLPGHPAAKPARKQRPIEFYRGLATLHRYDLRQAALAAGHVAMLSAGNIRHAFQPTNCEATPYSITRARRLTQALAGGQFIAAA